MKILTILLALTVVAFAQTQTTPGTTSATTSTQTQPSETDFLQEPSESQLSVPQTTLSDYIDANTGTITSDNVVSLIKDLFVNTATTLSNEHVTTNAAVTVPQGSQSQPVIDYAVRNFSGLFVTRRQKSGGSTTRQLNDKILRKGPFIINVVIWSVKNTQSTGQSNAPNDTTTNNDTSKGSQSTTWLPDERWYVYENGKLSSTRRLFGTHRFWFLYIHLNRPTTYPVRYDFTITQTTPTNLQHLYQLASILVSGAQVSGRAATQNDAWGGKQIDSSFSTSDIVVSSRLVGASMQGQQQQSSQPGTNANPGSGTPSGTSANGQPSTSPSSATSKTNTTSTNATTTSNANNPGSANTTNGTQNKATTQTATGDSLDSPQTFHNESASWWDVSLGFPATNVNQLTFQAAGAGLAPQTTDRRRLLGLLDIYWLRQQRKQIAERNFSWIPSVIVGVPLANQPLHRPLAAFGWGPPLLQFYIGGTVVKQPTAPTGQKVTACTGWCSQFTAGINFGVKAVADKLKGK